MALRIVEDCINCAACEADCPNQAISRDETEGIFRIDHERCTECVGALAAPHCVEACPVDCIVADPDHAETHDTLLARYESLHVD
jgi:formate hydrogenlyase subunit 6/NADH:ubiquinone oxidoreductase subunit I